MNIKPFSLLCLIVIGILTYSTTLSAYNGLSFGTLRQQGMGGVGIAQTFDSSAMYINPAGLSEAKSEIKLPRVRVDVNSTTLANSSKIQDLLNAKTKDERLNKLKLLVPLTVAFKPAVPTVISFINPGFGIGVFGQGDIYARFVNPVVPQIILEGAEDLSPMIAASSRWRLFDTDVAIGMTVRYIARSQILDPITGDTTLIRNSSDLMNGDDGSFTINPTTLTGIGGDVGALMPLGTGKLGVVLYNIGSTLSGTTPSQNAVTKTIPMFVGIGYAQTIDASSIPLVGGLLGSFDAGADVKFQYNDMYKNIYLGVEKQLFGDFIKLRAGLHQGYATAGLGLDAFIFHIQYAYYTEEKGLKVGNNPESYHGLEIGILL